MTKAERLNTMLNIIKTAGYISVEELSQKLYVSLPTVRRDLNELKRKNLIERSHGGAMARSEHNADIPFDFRNTHHTKAKAKIAKAAGTLVNNGDVIFIDAATTTLHILEYIKNKKDLTVITNSILAALYLQNCGVRVYSTGGMMLDNSLAYGGSISEEILGRFNIDIMFFSSYGLLEDGTIQDYSEYETSLRIKALSMAGKSVFLCDKSKIGKKSLLNVTNISQIDYLVTDAEPENALPLPKIKTIYAN